MQLLIFVLVHIEAIKISLTSTCPREVVREVLGSCNLPRDYVDNIPVVNRKPPDVSHYSAQYSYVKPRRTRKSPEVRLK